MYYIYNYIIKMINIKYHIKILYISNNMKYLLYIYILYYCIVYNINNMKKKKIIKYIGYKKKKT